MALVLLGSSCCSICGEVLEAGQDITATSGCCFPPGHHLREHCDAGMHWDCFWKRTYREEFSRGNVESHIEGSKEAYAAALVRRDEDCVVMVEPAKRAWKSEDSGVAEDPRIHIFIWSTNSHYQITASGWLNWLTGSAASRPGEESILVGVRANLASLYPRASMLLQGLDAEAHVAKQRAFIQTEHNRLRQRAYEAEQDIRDHNERLDCICLRQPACPRCGAPWARLRYYDLRPKGRRSCVICQDCERSSRIQDFCGDPTVG